MFYNLKDRNTSFIIG